MKSLKYKNQNYPLQWGLGAVEIYGELMGGGIEQLDLLLMPNNRNTKAIVSMIFAGAKNYAETEDLEFDLTYRKVQAALDSSHGNSVTEIIDDFLRSKYIDQTWLEMLGVEPISSNGEKKNPEEPSELPQQTS